MLCALFTKLSNQNEREEGSRREWNDGRGIQIKIKGFSISYSNFLAIYSSVYK
jgi:hypothetical protein